MESGKREKNREAEREQLERELWKAHREWELAQKRFDHALGDDEVDYAVFLLEAAEKRYDMLLRKLKSVYAEETNVNAEVQNKPKSKGLRVGFWKEGKGWHKDGSSS